METHEQKTPMRDVFLRTVAVLGLIAVLLLGAWGIIQLAVAIPGIFGSIGGGVSSLWSGAAQKESVSVSAPASLSSGQTLELNWNHQNGSGQYSYAISYACENGLSLKAPLPTGSYQTVTCNTPFNYTNATQSTTLVPSVTGSASVPLILSVSATTLSSGAITASGSATTNIAPQTAAATATAKPAATASATPSAAYYPAQTRAALYGYPDLAVTINSVVPNGSRDQVSFTIKNVGTNMVPAGWTFNASLPVNGSYTFASQPQQALYPGDKIVYTLGFDRSTYNTGYNYTYNQYPNQYPYNTYPYGYNNGYSYTGAAYYSGAGYYTCNSYGPCFNNNATYNSYPYNYNNYNYGYQDGVVTITADPQGAIYEINKTNNTASVPVY